MATSTPPTPPASPSARSAATSRKTPAGRTASSTASPPTTSWAWRSSCPTARSCPSAAWKRRKAAFASMGRISPNYIVQDGVIPRTKLPEVLREVSRLSAEAGLRVANVFHAGDGNLHPLVLYDRRIAGQEHRAEALAAAI